MWITKFEEAFDDLADDLSVVLTARRIRRNWLLGQLFLRFSKNDLRCQTRGLAFDPSFTDWTPDISCSVPTPMIAQVNIESTKGGYPGRLTGNLLDESKVAARERAGRIDIDESGYRKRREFRGSLIESASRLRASLGDGDGPLEAYQLLVLHRNGNLSERGRLAIALRLSPNETTLNYPHFSVRIWLLSKLPSAR